MADFNAGPRSVKTSSKVNNMRNKHQHIEHKVVGDDFDSDFDGDSMVDSDEDFDSDDSQD